MPIIFFTVLALQDVKLLMAVAVAGLDPSSANQVARL